MDSKEKRIANQFGSFCVRVLKNKSLNIDKANSLNDDSIKSLVDLTRDEFLNIAQYDKYFEHDHIFNVSERSVIVKSDLISAALCKISEDHRNIILLSYFLELSDYEIGKIFNMVRRSVTNKRRAALKKLKKIIETEDLL